MVVYRILDNVPTPFLIVPWAVDTNHRRRKGFRRGPPFHPREHCRQFVTICQWRPADGAGKCPAISLGRCGIPRCQAHVRIQAYVFQLQETKLDWKYARGLATHEGQAEGARQRYILKDAKLDAASRWPRSSVRPLSMSISSTWWVLYRDPCPRDN